MTQSGVYLALYALGVAFQLGFGPRQQPALCCALGFITGLALWVIAALALLVTPIAYASGTAIAAYAIPACLCAAVAARRWRPDRRTLIVIAIWTAGFAAIVLWLGSFDASRFSPDSKNLVVAGLNLTEGGDKDLGYFSAKGAFTVLAHSLAGFTADDYFHALSATVGLSLGPIFVMLGWRGLALLGAHGLAPRVLVVVAAAAALTTYNVAFHLVYIHTNLGAAVYLLACLGLFWLAEHEENTAYLPAAFLFLGAYTLHRLEGPVFAAAVILIAVFPSRLPRRALTIGLAAYAIPCACFYARISLAGEIHDDQHLSQRIAQAIAGGTLALLAAWLVVSRTRWIAHARHLPRALLIALALGLVIGGIVEPDAMRTSADALYQNLLTPRHGLWGYTWYVVLALGALSLLAPPLPSGRVLSYGGTLTVLLVALIGITIPYRVGATDSANRMMIQVLPVAMFYLTMRMAPLLSPQDE